MKLRQNAIDLRGRTFGHLTVLDIPPGRRKNALVWTCRCACGAQCVATTNVLTYGRKKSCGCQSYVPQHPLDLIMITTPSVVQAIREHASTSHTTPSRWATEVLELFLMQHRSGRFVGDPTRHETRDADTTMEQENLM